MKIYRTALSWNVFGFVCGIRSIAELASVVSAPICESAMLRREARIPTILVVAKCSVSHPVLAASCSGRLRIGSGRVD